MAQPDLPPLKQVSVADLPTMALPTLKIRTDEDVSVWRESEAYRDYGAFLRRLSESVVGHALPWISPAPSKVCSVDLH